MLRHLGRKILVAIFAIALLSSLPLPASARPAQAAEQMPGEPTPLIEPVFAAGGQVKALAVSGDLVYVVQGGRFVVLDAADPEQIVEMGSVYLPHLASADQLIISGNLAFVATGFLGLVIIDTTDPSTPAIGGTYSEYDPFLMNSLVNIAVQDHFAYLALGRSGIRVLDVSDPDHPVPVGMIARECYSCTLKFAGSYLFVLDSSLDIYDSSNPAEPVWVSSAPVNAADLAMDGKYIYASTVVPGIWGKYGGTPGKETLVVLDISNPQFPTQVGSLEFSLNFSSSSGALQLQDGWIYLDGLGTKLIDIEVPYNPIILAEYSIPFSKAFVSEGRIFYVENYVLNIADLHNPDPPSKVGQYGSLEDPFCVRVANSVAYIWVATGNTPWPLYIYDVHNPVQPILLSIRYDFNLDGLCHAHIPGDRAYTTDFLFDLSDPADPKMVAQFQFKPGNYYDIAIEGNLAYLVSVNGLSIYDISVPLQPQLLSEFGDGFGSVEVANGWVYAHAGNLTVIDARDPRSPRIAGKTESYIGPDFMVLVDHYIVFDGSSLIVVDVSNPSLPWLTYSIGKASSGNRYKDGLLYELSAGRLSLIDLREPSLPQWVQNDGWPFNSDTPSSFDVENDLIYLAGIDTGLQILRVNRQSLPPKVIIYHSYLPGVTR